MVIWRALLHWAPAGAYALLIFLISHQSDVSGPGWIPDALAHLIEYAGFGLTLAWGFSAGLTRPLNAWRAGLACLVAALYALSDEFHQSFVPSRHPSALDAAVDVLGAACSLALVWLLGRKRRI